MATLEDAVEAYRGAQARLAEVEAEAAAIVRAQRDLIEQCRVELAAAIVDAAEHGRRQVEIIQVTGYARETVRRILRAGGVEAD